MNQGLPKIGVATLLFDSSDRILLAKRISDHEGGRYGCPGGKVDFGESPEEAARRELWEETHMRADSIYPIGYVANCVYPNEGSHFLCIWFMARVSFEDKDVRFVETTAEGKPKSEGWDWYGEGQLAELPLMLSTKDALDYYHYSDRLGRLKIVDYMRE